jgi:hypothetical protein
MTGRIDAGFFLNRLCRNGVSIEDEDAMKKVVKAVGEGRIARSSTGPDEEESGSGFGENLFAQL